MASSSPETLICLNNSSASIAPCSRISRNKSSTFSFPVFRVTSDLLATDSPNLFPGIARATFAHNASIFFFCALPHGPNERQDADFKPGKVRNKIRNQKRTHSSDGLKPWPLTVTMSTSSGAPSFSRISEISVARANPSDFAP